MSGINELLRDGIISKLKAFDAYIDNELPDYIMVMMANNKTVEQVNEELQLFLGEHTDQFTAWLREAIANPDLLRKMASAKETPQSRKRKKSREENQEFTKRPPQESLEVVYEPQWDEEDRPITKISKMHSDRYEEETEARRDRELRGEVRGRGGEETEARRDRELRGEVRGRGGEETEARRDRELRGEVRGRGGEETEARRDRELRGEVRGRGGEETEARRDRELYGEVRGHGGERQDEIRMCDEVRVRDEVRGRIERQGDGRVRSERPSLKIYEAPSSRASAKKTVMAQPDSTRDQDLRELIGQDLRGLIGVGGGHRSSSRGQLRHTHQLQQEVGRRSGRGQSEEEEEVEEEDGLTTPTTTMASVVKLVERPKRTDVGGSRLLHRAILGLAPIGKQRGASLERGRRGAERENVIFLPASVLKDGSAKKLVMKQIVSDPLSGIQYDVEGTYEEGDEDDDDEVIVNVDDEEEGQFVEAAGLEQLSEAAVDALKQRGKIKVLKSPPDHVILREGGDGEGGGKEMDLRAIINKSREERTEKINPRFVVTLSGAGDLDKESDESALGRGSPLLLEPRRMSAKDRLGTRSVVPLVEEEEEAEKEEDKAATGAGSMSEVLERCRFWPNCKNGDNCPYHHPSRACKLFPECKFGSKCLFVHPQCKFNSRCTRADCPYLHTAPRHLAAKPQSIPQIMPAPMPPMFRPPFRPSSYSYSSGGPSRTRSRFPNKSALSWKPPTAHISERKFALPDEQ